MDAGIGRLRLNLFGGTGNVNLSKFTGVNGITGSVHDVIGLAADLDGDGWGVHAAYSRNRHDLSITAGALTLPFKANVENFSVGYRLEKFNIVNWAEYFYQRNTDDEPTLNMARAGYVLLGYKIGAFMPRYMFTHQQQNIGLPPQAQNNHVIGLNYQLAPQAVLKAEYEMGKVADGYAPASATRAPTSTATDIQAVYAGIDFIF
jgi:predicted porin